MAIVTEASVIYDNALCNCDHKQIMIMRMTVGCALWAY